jgi:hypothetical protein
MYAATRLTAILKRKQDCSTYRVLVYISNSISSCDVMSALLSNHQLKQKSRNVKKRTFCKKVIDHQRAEEQHPWVTNCGGTSKADFPSRDGRQLKNIYHNYL